MTERREIERGWHCKRSGDCCLAIPEIVVTKPELREMQAASDRQLHLRPHEDDRFIRVLTPGGCPYLDRELNGDATCSIHESRPYQCRRFQCQRPDPSTEPYEASGPLGCKNLTDRLEQSRYALKFYESNQHRAQPWARAHGWVPSMR